MNIRSKKEKRKRKKASIRNELACTAVGATVSASSLSCLLFLSGVQVADTLFYLLYKFKATPGKITANNQRLFCFVVQGLITDRYAYTASLRLNVAMLGTSWGVCSVRYSPLQHPPHPTPLPLLLINRHISIFYLQAPSTLSSQMSPSRFYFFCIFHSSIFLYPVQEHVSCTKVTWPLMS